MTPRLVMRNRHGWLHMDGRRYRVCTDRRGRHQVYLGLRHRFANRGGRQWVARVLLAWRLGYLPARSIHAHHRDGRRDRDTLGNVKGLELRAHLSLEAGRARRDALGRFSR